MTHKKKGCCCIRACLSGVLPIALFSQTIKQGGKDFKESIKEMHYSTALIVLQRDKTEGEISVGADGFSPHINYVLNGADAQSMLWSLKKGFRIAAAAGAVEIGSSHNKDTRLKITDELRKKGFAEGDNGVFEEYLASVVALGLPSNGYGLFSAHQMGSCRMGRLMLASTR